MAQKTKILFMHGLESGPLGSKARWLQSRYDCVCPDMDMSLWRPSAENGVLRCVVRNMFSTLPWNLASEAGRDSLLRCLAVQEQAIAEHNPSVVVASSWGGAVAQLALARGLWAGPTILLAPAYTLVADRFGLTDATATADAIDLSPESVFAAIAALPEAVRSRVVTVHGDADDTVPVQYSREFVQRAGVAPLREVRGGDHRLNIALMCAEQPLLEQLIADVLAP